MKRRDEENARKNAQEFFLLDVRNITKQQEGNLHSSIRNIVLKYCRYFFACHDVAG